MRAGFAGFVAAGLVAASCWVTGCSEDVTHAGGEGGGGATTTTTTTTTASGGSGGGTGGEGGVIPPAPDATSVDLLLVVDNSRGMGEKQALLAAALPDLILGVVNPPCVDANGQPAPTQPATPLDPCSAGTSRIVLPILDLHVGVISTSIGGHGADACPSSVTNGCLGGGTNTTNDDKAHLLARKDPCGNQTVATYAGKGFLAWDPLQQANPPGETQPAALVATLQDLVLGAGTIGCGYEAQLESVVRFLVDPAPYESISAQGAEAVKSGVDSVLLQQRKDFLRPDSLLGIVMVTDENDCSTIEGGQYFYANQIKNGDGSAFHLPKARSECAQSPDDPCCASCGQAVPANCPADPSCGTLSDLDDNINVRCFEQKRRFGIDFLYPVQRYVNALRRPHIDPAALDLVGGAAANPVFSDLDPADAHTVVRDPTLVFFTGIVGVPWQLVAHDPTDITQGLMTAAELEASGAWAAIAGSPDAHVPPTDPHMVESTGPRAGLSTQGNDPMNGHEYTVPKKDSLQYACIFDLPQALDCSDPAQLAASCDCADGSNDNPLCTDPGSGQNTLQVRDKAMPGLRQLAVLHGLGDQGVVASACAADAPDPDGAGHGYRPAVAATLAAWRTRLAK